MPQVRNVLLNDMILMFDESCVVNQPAICNNMLGIIFLKTIDCWFFICTFCPRKQIGGRAPLEGLLPRNDPQKFLRAQGGGRCPATGGHRGILGACPFSCKACVIPKFFWCVFWIIWLSTIWLNWLYLVYFLLLNKSYISRKRISLSWGLIAWSCECSRYESHPL